MAKRPNSEAYTAIRTMVRDVEDLIDGGKWSLDRQAADKWRRCPWAGAGVIICESTPNDLRSSDTCVVSPYVVELSWLIDTLKNVCSGFIDYRNKEAFYGRLADAANRYLSQRLPMHHNPKDMCFAVVREVMRVVEEANSGELSGIRNEVRIRQIWVQLHPGASENSAGLAVYWMPASLRVSLANESFVFQEKQYRVGESTEMLPSGDEVMHMATYHEAK